MDAILNFPSELISSMQGMFSGDALAALAPAAVGLLIILGIMLAITD